MEPASRPRYYPLFVNLEGRHVVVVGGGRVAQRKARALIAHGAEVTLIAPSITEEIERFVADELINFVGRDYVGGDLEGAFLVVCATDSEETNRAVHAEAESRNQLVNVVDVPELCNFIVPSVMRRGDLQIAISTAGAAPAVAKRLRKRLQEEFGEEWAEYVALLGDLRGVAMRRLPEEAQRKRLFEAAADSDLLERVREGEAPDAEELFDEVSRTLAEEP
ncbi:MAG: bifunctional precorrin-2 dehydrogenase/sirohydrochlorin ferrochelatase [Coriobacteriia bacterium]|nr:bifunctional precorrin-2 dehydrogenase/sirohydrochlorin ferrochelatase [Coriobacteriia bacterium]